MEKSFFEEIKHLNNALLDKRVSFTKEDILFLSGKSTPRGRLVHFMTSGYYRREQLWKTGRLVWAYVFKSFDDHPDNGRPFPSWVLFSPQAVFEEKPELLIQIHSNLQVLANQTKPAKELRPLWNALNEPINEPVYLEIPLEFSQNHLVYLSMVLVYPEHFLEFTYGLKPLVINPETTKEAMFLPDDFIG